MSTIHVTGLAVVPAYRVVAHFLKQARGLTGDQALDALEHKVREYVRNSLSPLHGSYAEIGERWAVTQLGDPNLDVLGEALRMADSAAPRTVVEDALGRSVQPSAQARPLSPLPASSRRWPEQAPYPGHAGSDGR